MSRDIRFNSFGSARAGPGPSVVVDRYMDSKSPEYGMTTTTDDAERGAVGTRAVVDGEDEDADDGFEKIASSVGACARAVDDGGVETRGLGESRWLNGGGTFHSTPSRGVVGRTMRGGRAIARVSIVSCRFALVSWRLTRERSRARSEKREERVERVVRDVVDGDAGDLRDASRGMGGEIRDFWERVG